MPVHPGGPRVLETDLTGLHAQALRRTCAWLVVELDAATGHPDGRRPEVVLDVLADLLGAQPVCAHILRRSLPVLGTAYWCRTVVDHLVGPLKNGRAAPVLTTALVSFASGGIPLRDHLRRRS